MNRRARASLDPTARETAAVEPSWRATLILLVGTVLTSYTLGSDTPSSMAHHAAVGMGLSLSLATLIEVRRSRANMLRADLVCMVALYYLLFLEFLFPQPNLDAIARNYEMGTAIQVALWS